MLDLGDLGVADQLAGVRIDDGAGISHRGPRVVGDLRDRGHDGGVLGQHDGEHDAGLEAGVDHRSRAVGRIAADQDLAGRAGGPGGPDRLGDHRRRALPGACFAGPQPDPGDHRRACFGADRRHQRGQALAEHLFAGDLRVPVAGALLGVPEHRAQQRIDIDQRPLLQAGQQIAVLPEVDQVRAQHRPELHRMAVGELAQELPQRRGRIHAAEQAFHATGADRVQIVDAVRAARHPGDDRGQLPGRVHPCGLDLRRGRVDPDPLADQLREPGPLGQRQQRRQPRERHEIDVIELRTRTRPHIR